jgi:hypothetical protein
MTGQVLLWYDDVLILIHQRRSMAMTSVSQEHLIPQVEQAITNVLWKAAEQLARPTGLIQRQGGQVTGRNFAQTLVLGWLANPAASLETLAQQGAAVGLEISAQGLDQRFTTRAAEFLQALFEVALAQVVVADPVAIPLLQRFAGVCLEDSSTMSLPAALKPLFQGNGGKASPAACKIFVRLDMLRGQLTCSPLQNGRKADTATPLETVPTPGRTLHLRDRGFTDLERWKAEDEQGQLVLSYLRSDVLVWDEHGQPLDLVTWLPQAGESGERQVLVGQQKLPMRLFFERVPPEVAKRRRKRLRQQNLERGQTLSKRVEWLAGWTIAVTTVPVDLLQLDEALVLLRLRWQIELLFKLWKQHGLLDEWRTKKVERILCEVYAKLLGLLLQHWLLIISCWQEPHRSLVKAAKAVRGQVALLSAALDGDLDLSLAIARIQKVAQAGARLNSRQDAPNTSQLLLRGSNQWSSKPLRKRKEYRRKTQQFLA